MKILVVAPAWIGDTIIAQPLLMRLHQQHPNLILDALAPAWSAPLLARMAEVRRTVASPFRHGVFGFSARRRLAHTLREENYDQAFVLPNSWKSALVPYFANIPRRTGYHGEARYLLLNDRHQLDTFAHPQLAQRYAALAGPLVSGVLQTQLSSTPAQQAEVRAVLGLPSHSTPIIFCPGAEYGPAKRWPAHHFAALARLLHERSEREIWLVGSSKDKGVGDDIAQTAPGICRNLCGLTTLEQAIDLIATARLVVSNDSGLMHVAAALGRPLLALYGSSSATYTPPLSVHAKMITLYAECSPCFKRECPLGHFKCMNDLTPQQVLAAMSN